MVLPILLALVWIYLNRLRPTKQHASSLILNFGLGLSVVLALASGIKVGSAENHFFGPLYWALLLLSSLLKFVVSDSGFALLLLVLGVSLG